MDKHVLITIIKGLQLQLNSISSQLEFLTEQIALMNQRSFGHKTEKLDQMHQMSLFEVFNEPEFFSDDSEEPEVSEIIVPSHTRKTKTLREENLKGLPVRVYEHELKKEELNRLFPNGYKEIKPVVYKRLSIIPQTFLVDEHRIHQYTSKDNDGRIIKAKRSPDLFRNSIATASLVAAIINGSYMWVYCTGESEKHPVILYDYRSTRKADHPKEFLRNYSGILVTDGYQVYHSLEKQKDDLKVAGCWVHAKRKYAELVKATGIPELEGTVAAQGVALISELFHLDGLCDKSKDKDRKDYRQREVAPSVPSPSGGRTGST